MIILPLSDLPCCFHGADEELRAICIRSSIGHRQNSWKENHIQSKYNTASILYKSTAGRYQGADGPLISAHYRFV